MTTNKTVLKWLDEMNDLLTPDKVVWVDGTDEQTEELRKIAVELGELEALNQEKLPDCYLHRTNPNDVARVEDRTFICTTTKEEAGPTNNWCDPAEMYEKLYNIARGSYKGKTMYVTGWYTKLQHLLFKLVPDFILTKLWLTMLDKKQ